MDTPEQDTRTKSNKQDHEQKQTMKPNSTTNIKRKNLYNRQRNNEHTHKGHMTNTRSKSKTKKNRGKQVQGTKHAED